MANAIISVSVKGIFDRQDITFDFSRSPFFIVGPNGTGKSTALKILHCILTAQWSDIEAFPFHAAEIEFDDETGIVIDRTDFSLISRIVFYLDRVPKRAGRAFLYPLDWLDYRNAILHQGSRSKLRRVSSISVDELAEIYPLVAPLLNIISTQSRGRVLYFPTYRRVERDLGELLRSDDPFDEEDLSIQPQIIDRFKSTGEVVGFGGQDISKLLSDTAASIDVAARQALNEHSVRFLEALSNQKPTDTKIAKALIQSVDQTNHLLRRIATFSDLNLDMKSVIHSIDDIRALLSKKRPGRPNQAQEMMLIYIGELIILFDKIEELSYPLQKFTSLLSRYLSPAKSATLNTADNKITISDLNGTVITAEQLSSGEKQVIAFFAFLLLNNGPPPRYIIIDEPELSLSVSWQKTLIRDIESISSGAYILSATHSPFIFEQSGIDNVESLGVL